MDLMSLNLLASQTMDFATRLLVGAHGTLCNRIEHIQGINVIAAVE